MIVKNPKGKKVVKITEKVDSKTGEISEDFLPEDETPAPKAEEKKPKIEVNPDLPFYKFSLKQITVKEVDKVTQRTLVISVINYMTKVFMSYNAIMVCDTEKFENKLAAIEKAKVEYEAQQQTSLLPDVRAKDLARYDEQIRDTKIKMAEMMAECPDISFASKVLKVDDSGDFIKLELKVTEQTITDMNHAWNNIGNYKIQLQHATV